MTQLLKRNPTGLFSNLFVITKISLIPPVFINDKFLRDIKTKASIFNKFFAEPCTPLKNDNVLPTSEHVLTQSRLHSIDFRFEEI